MTLFFPIAPDPPGPTNIARVWDAVQPLDRAHGATWYQDARRALMAATRYPLVPSAAITAVLSPRLYWDRNLALAHAVLQDRVPERIFLRSRYNLACEIRRRARRGMPFVHLVRGPKVRAFYRCVLGQDAWVIDTHMVSILHATPHSGKIHPNRYHTYAGIYENWYQSLTTTTPYSRSQCQAILWLTWKRRFLLHGRKVKT